MTTGSDQTYWPCFPPPALKLDYDTALRPHSQPRPLKPHPVLDREGYPISKPRATTTDIELAIFDTYRPTDKICRQARYTIQLTTDLPSAEWIIRERTTAAASEAKYKVLREPLKRRSSWELQYRKPTLHTTISLPSISRTISNLLVSSLARPERPQISQRLNSIMTTRDCVIITRFTKQGPAKTPQKLQIAD
ncbi:hypothetical protein FMUND_4496 [Fusarium mundagurra]|uniref:Uncharacterized protein n=1 Tax=Fusarium mundagurra TaxID=1567541 RepID=A0A8H5YVH2_9HYPO|nr:hypothetical protein FMUND_4496 [Fusarium mundagurra]